MRIFVIISILTCVASGQVPNELGPFGLRQAMTKAEIVRLVGQGAVSEVKDKPESLCLLTVPKPHPAFQAYDLTLSPEIGLVRIVAYGKDIPTNVFGGEVRDTFAEIKAALSKIYGVPRSYDSLQDGSIWTAPQYWMMALLKKERTLGAIWGLTLSNPNHIVAIGLEGKALSQEKGYVALSYELEGYAEFKKHQAAKDASVF